MISSTNYTECLCATIRVLKPRCRSYALLLLRRRGGADGLRLRRLPAACCPRRLTLRENVPFLSAFPMFVPSLSW